MRWIGLLLLVGAIAYFRFYPEMTQTEQARYRLTVTIDTPEGPRRGTGVWGYSKAAWFDNRGAPVPTLRWYFGKRIDGEAIPIDVGHGRTLYMVLGGRWMPHPTFDGLAPAYFSNGYMNTMPESPLQRHGETAPLYLGYDRQGAKKEFAWIKAQRGRTVSLDCSPVLHRGEMGECPAIVLADRSGVHITLLDPDDLGAVLGLGYRLRGVTLEVTDDPVTKGIEQRLPWVLSFSAGSLGGSRTPESELRTTGFSRHDPARLR